jgi:hypothetical protein
MLIEVIKVKGGDQPFGLKRFLEKREAVILVRTINELIKITSDPRIITPDNKRFRLKGSLAAVHAPNIVKITTYGWQEESTEAIYKCIMNKCAAAAHYIEIENNTNSTKPQAVTIYVETCEAKKILSASDLVDTKQNTIQIQRTFTNT